MKHRAEVHMDNSLIKEIDSFMTAAERRRIVLCKRRNPVKPFVIVVYIRDRSSGKETLLSFSEYYTEEVARHDFERRRPNMHIEEGEVPMQRGKRLVQELLAEKLK